MSLLELGSEVRSKFRAHVDQRHWFSCLGEHTLDISLIYMDDVPHLPIPHRNVDVTIAGSISVTAALRFHTDLSARRHELQSATLPSVIESSLMYARLNNNPYSLTPQTPLPAQTPTHSAPCPVKPDRGAQLTFATSYSHFQLASGPLPCIPLSTPGTPGTPPPPPVAAVATGPPPLPFIAT